MWVLILVTRVLSSDSVVFLTDLSLNDIKRLLNTYAKYLHKSNLTALKTGL